MSKKCTKNGCKENIKQNKGSPEAKKIKIVGVETIAKFQK
jgi:hypothetical protein